MKKNLLLITFVFGFSVVAIVYMILKNFKTIEQIDPVLAYSLWSFVIVYVLFLGGTITFLWYAKK